MDMFRANYQHKASINFDGVSIFLKLGEIFIILSKKSLLIFLYNGHSVNMNIRRDFFDKIMNISPNFRNMDTPSKIIWIFTNENEQIMKDLGTYIEESFSL